LLLGFRRGKLLRISLSTFILLFVEFRLSHHHLVFSR
jgi:hypothetical protein